MNNSNKTRLPLTQSQLSLWAGQRIHSEVPLHNVVYTFEIQGDIDGVIFKRSFEQLVEETDILRMTFSEIAGEPFQEINSTIPFQFEYLDFTEKSQEEIDQWVRVNTQSPINLAEIVFDSRLLKCDESKFIWFLKIHHLVTDAVTYQLLFHRLSDIYQARLNNNESKNELRVYRSYLEYEREQVADQELNSNKEYWDKKTSKVNSRPALYGEKWSKNSTEAKRIEITLTPTQTEKLNNLCQKTGVRSWTKSATLYNLFVTVFATYLHRTSGLSKFNIGSPAHNRSTLDFSKTAGLFIEVLPLTIKIDDDETFISLLDKIKIEGNSFLKNVHPSMVGCLNGEPPSNILNFINVEFKDFNGWPTQVRWIHNGHIDASHDIRCHVYDFKGEGDYTIAFDINTSVCPQKDYDKVALHFNSILDSLLENLENAIDQKGLEPISQSTILSGTHTPLKDSFLKKFEEFAAKTPNKVAVQSFEQTLTYSNLNKKANQLAGHLAERGIENQSRVAVFLHRSPDYLISILAIMKLGGVFVPIASDQPLERVQYILRKADCSLIITEQKLAVGLDFEKENIVSTSHFSELENQNEFSSFGHDLENLSYILFTSGSTGKPKGVGISNKSLNNYLNWARTAYSIDQNSVFPLFTSIGFDLTLTSVFLPILCGGRIIVYKENPSGPDTSVLNVFSDNLVNKIKLTPSHLDLVKEHDFSPSVLETMILGGEDLKTTSVSKIQSQFSEKLEIFNEYGPTEATVGCIVSKYDAKEHKSFSVPIGLPIDNTQVLLLDTHKNLVPQGVVGEIYLSGACLANGYINDQELTNEKFLENPFSNQSKIYRTGDLGRLNSKGELEYHGRIDSQIKLRGYRIELNDIEANLSEFEGIDSCAVMLVDNKDQKTEEKVFNCTNCGLPSNYPSTDFDENGVCHLCRAFENYEEKVHQYFKRDEELVRLLTSKRDINPNYDCISLLSGGKDSTYVLARLVGMGLRVLAFTMDNGYISEQAKENIDRIVKRLGVDHVYGKTPHMNAIFVDSLQRHHNVCNGCFKTIYTLSTKIAVEKQIPFIVTGLSRGQFFETRLTEELFWDQQLDSEKIDNTILEARKLYHQENDAVKELLDVSMFDSDEVFDQVQFVDFYRFSDVSLEEMLVYLKKQVGWKRPTDTGRSTNCLINQVGIYVHKKDLGYSNYSFPYSWDVRLGHKTRDESLEEINEVIDETEVKRIMNEIGYDPSAQQENDKKLVAYFTGAEGLSIEKLRKFMNQRVPSYMVPTLFHFVAEMPLTNNGKIDRAKLSENKIKPIPTDCPYVAPSNEIEELVQKIWMDVLLLDRIGIKEDFISLGGHSLAAIRVTARINEEIETNFPLNKIFEYPTIESYSKYVEETLIELMNKN